MTIRLGCATGSGDARDGYASDLRDKRFDNRREVVVPETAETPLPAADTRWVSSRGPVGALLLAAGGSSRFGAANKLLAPFDGLPLIVHAARAVRAAGLPCLAVTGDDADSVRSALAWEVEGIVHAVDWADGMGRSIAAGIAAVPPGWGGALVCLGDMPRIRPADIRALAAALTTPDAVAVPVHAVRRGNPVGFGRAWFSRLAALVGDQGARLLLAGARVTEVPTGPGVLHDIDTPADLSS